MNIENGIFTKKEQRNRNDFINREPRECGSSIRVQGSSEILLNSCFPKNCIPRSGVNFMVPCGNLFELRGKKKRLGTSVVDTT
jgi:hypothetical protein